MPMPEEIKDKIKKLKKGERLTLEDRRTQNPAIPQIKIEVEKL